MKKEIYGIVVPIITPVDENENVAESEFRALLRHCVDNGIHGIFVAGSNGEAMALTQKERDNAIRIALDEVRGKAPVISGVMDTSTRRVIDNIHRLEDMSGEYAVITPVFYARHATQKETVRLFEEVAAKTTAKLLIYNIPLYTGEKLTPETIIEISKIDHVIGYKDTSGSMDDFIKCNNYFKNSDFCLLQGSMALSMPSMLLGADGCIPSMAPLFPELYVKLYEFCKAGDIERAKRCDELMRMNMSLWKYTKNQTTATKYAISLTGLCNPRVISPTEPLLPEDAEMISRKYYEMKEIIDSELKTYLK